MTEVDQSKESYSSQDEKKQERYKEEHSCCDQEKSEFDGWYDKKNYKRMKYVLLESYLYQRLRQDSWQ